MSMRLKQAPQVWKLASDLGLKTTEDPVGGILHYCERKVRKFLRDSPDCNSLAELLEWVASKVGTTFEIAKTTQELLDIRQKYLERGERIFARLVEELHDDVFGVTFRLSNRESWELEFVSVIDCRGPKGARAYYTKWHEVSHLLVQTDQMRLKFRRTHCEAELKDPEEALIDVIAGKFAFYQPFFKEYTKGDISFDVIENLRARLCPDASQQAALIGLVNIWPIPCLLVEAQLALRKHEKYLLRQESLGFTDAPQPSLRAIKISPNDAAREIGLTIFENMRVPEESVISKVFASEVDSAEAEEDLYSWETSSGTRLQRQRVRVLARRAWGSVQALIFPI